MQKTARKEVRLSPQDEADIDEAARILSQSPSAFMVNQSAEAARRIIARADVTLMPAEQFDALLKSLDEPDAAPNLARLAEQPRRFKRA